MPQRRATQAVRENFHFDLTDWDFDYGLHLSPSPRTNPLGRCWEHNALRLRGPLRTKTRRRIDRVELRLQPNGYAPDDLPERVTGLGAVSRIRKGELDVFARLPPESFQSVFLGLVGGKVASAYLLIDFAQGDGVVQDVGVLPRRFDPVDDE